MCGLVWMSGCPFVEALAARRAQLLYWQCPTSRDALEWKGPRRRPQKRLGRRLEEVAKAVGGGYCRLQMPLRLDFAVGETVGGHRLGALEAEPPRPPCQCIFANEPHVPGLS